MEMRPPFAGLGLAAVAALMAAGTYAEPMPLREKRKVKKPSKKRRAKVKAARKAAQRNR